MGETSVKSLLEDSITTQQKILQDHIQELETTAGEMIKHLKDGKKLLICGNGGSAAQAQHFSAELVVRFERNRKGLPAICLSTDTSTLTACSNDFGYHDVFKRQVEALGNEGDILVGITTSGNSENVLRAFEAGKKKGMLNICLNGKDGGRTKDYDIDYNFIVPSTNTARIQDAHMTVIHIWCKLIEDAFVDSGPRHNIVSQFANKHILVVGDVMLDEYIFGEVNRISPEAPVPVLKVSKNEFRLGGAANVANNISSLGARCTIIGMVGNDDTKETLIKELGKNSIHHCLIERDLPTIKKTRIVAQGQQIVRVDREEKAPIDVSHVEKIMSFVESADADMIVVSDYDKGTITEALVSKLKSQSKPIIADPKPQNCHLFQGVYAVTPNIKEAKEITGKDSVEEMGRDMLNRLNAHVIITRGPQGLSIFEKGSDGYSHMPTKAKEVFDVSGAGDTFVSTLALAIASGGSLSESAFLGNLASGVVVGKLGTATLSLDELRNALNESSLE